MPTTPIRPRERRRGNRQPLGVSGLVTEPNAPDKPLEVGMVVSVETTLRHPHYFGRGPAARPLSQSTPSAPIGPAGRYGG